MHREDTGANHHHLPTEQAFYRSLIHPEYVEECVYFPKLSGAYSDTMRQAPCW